MRASSHTSRSQCARSRHYSTCGFQGDAVGIAQSYGLRALLQHAGGEDGARTVGNAAAGDADGVAGLQRDIVLLEERGVAEMHINGAAGGLHDDVRAQRGRGRVLGEGDDRALEDCVVRSAVVGGVPQGRRSRLLLLRRGKRSGQEMDCDSADNDAANGE